MSRLDYITIAIVAACILAIIFLVYKMTDLFNEQPGTDNIENTSGKVEEEEDGVYDYEIDGSNADSDDGTAATDDEASTDAAGGDTSAAEGDDEDAASDNAAGSGGENTAGGSVDRPAVPTSSDSAPARISSGKFMVIAGTFSKKSNARQHLQKLRNLGYSNASVENFDRGKYDVVLVDRFNNMADAERLVKDLKAEGVSSYVKIKDGNR